MTALECLKMADTLCIVEYMISSYDLFKMIDIDNRIDNAAKIKLKEQCTDKYIMECNAIKRYTVIPDENSILMISCSLSDGTPELSLLKTDETDKISQGFSCDTITEFSNPLYGVCLVRRKKLLSYTINSQNLMHYGIYAFAAAILYQCISFGIEDETRNKKIDNIIKSLYDTDIKKCASMEELFPPMDNEENKQEYLNNMNKWYHRLKNDVYGIISDI